MTTFSYFTLDSEGKTITIDLSKNTKRPDVLRGVKTMKHFTMLKPRIGKIHELSEKPSPKLSFRQSLSKIQNTF